MVAEVGDGCVGCETGEIVYWDTEDLAAVVGEDCSG